MTPPACRPPLARSLVADGRSPSWARPARWDRPSSGCWRAIPWFEIAEVAASERSVGTYLRRERHGGWKDELPAAVGALPVQPCEPGAVQAPDRVLGARRGRRGDHRARVRPRRALGAEQRQEFPDGARRPAGDPRDQRRALGGVGRAARASRLGGDGRHRHQRQLCGHRRGGRPRPAPRRVRHRASDA